MAKFLGEDIFTGINFREVMYDRKIAKISCYMVLQKFTAGEKFAVVTISCLLCHVFMTHDT